MDRSPNDYLSQIIQALEIAHAARSTQDARWQAYVFLNEVPRHPEGPQFGLILASDLSRSPTVRHYGLSLLEEAIRPSNSKVSIGTIESWLWDLAAIIRQDDPIYYRNKVAKLWVDFAKTHWVKDWMNLDKLLVALWTKEEAHKELVAAILENLSEDVFKKDDSLASLHMLELNSACVEMFTPLSVFQELHPSRRSTNNVRFGEEGWLVRLTDFLDSILPDHVLGSDYTRACALRIYAALRSAMSWSVPKAIALTRCTERLAKGLVVPSYDMQLVRKLIIDWKAVY